MPPNDGDGEHTPVNLEKRIATLEAFSRADLAERIAVLEATKPADLRDRISKMETDIGWFKWLVAGSVLLLSVAVNVVLRLVWLVGA